MKGSARVVLQALRYVAGCLLAFALWTFWLGLILLIFVQVYVASTNELAVPAFVLRRLEARIAETGLKVTFDRATFDPTGRILVESPQVFLPALGDPVVKARAGYVVLNPWLAVVGKFEFREIRLVSATLSVPAMLSPSGRAEPIIDDIDAYLVPTDTGLAIRHVSARLGALQISVRGALTYVQPTGRSSGQLAAQVQAHFGEFCRSAVGFMRRLDALESPALDLELTPSPSRAAFVTANLVAEGFKLDSPLVANIRHFRASTRFPLTGDAPSMSQLEVVADEVHLPEAVAANRVSALITGRVRLGELRVDPLKITFTADALKAMGLTAEQVSATIQPAEMPHWRGSVVGRVLDSELAVSGEVDTKAQSAKVDFAGAIAPRIIDAINARVPVDVRQFFDFTTFHCDRGHAEFGNGWKFQKLTAYVAITGIRAHGVQMDEGRALIQVDPVRLFAPEAFARIGENFARGSYEHVFATREFRFLLDGQLRPMDISDWFQDWWPNFFDRFAFPASPPVASVDVQGVWREGRKSSVFVFADTKAPIIQQQKLARVRTRLFIRPGFYDGLELSAIDDRGGNASGTFTVTSNVETAAWRTLDVDAHSTVGLDVAKGIAGPLSTPILQPFELTHSPVVNFRGHFDGPDLTGVRHRTLDLDARTLGPFKFAQIPFDDAAFTVVLRDDAITVDAPEARFAGGKTKAHVKVWGSDPDQRVSFDTTFSDASLGLAVTALQDVAAERKGQSKPASGKFVQERANVRIDLTASGEGAYGNMLSFHGGGTAVLRGPEIGQVPLFGPLSELLKFTALRFTNAHTTFKLNGPKIEFSEFALRGANSAIDAHGEYALDRRQLDFRAKVFPFQESGSIVKSVVGAVLSPISNVLEVKLTGTLEKPDWAFVIGPTNLLRSLAPGEPAPSPAGQPPAPPVPAGSTATGEKTAPAAPEPAKEAAADGTTKPKS